MAIDLTPEEFEVLVSSAMGRAGAASRGVTRETGRPEDQLEALATCAGLFGMARHLSRNFTPDGTALMNRVADEVYRRATLATDCGSGRTVC